jgi:putative ABC transport system permease protein
VFWIAVRTVRTHWVLFCSSFVALCLGVALVASTGQLLLSTARPKPPEGIGRFDAAAVMVAADQTVGAGLGNQRTSERRRIPAATADTLRGVGQVVVDRTFTAQVIADAEPVDSGQHRFAGHGWSSAALTPYTLTEGRAPTSSGDVVVSGILADQGDIALGDRIDVVTPGGVAGVTVSGIAAPPGERGVPGELAVFFTDETAATMSGAPEMADAIGVLPSTQSTLDSQAAAAGAALAGQPLAVTTGDAKGGKIAAEMFTATTNEVAALLGLMAVISAFVSVFVVAGTFAFVVVQRRREIALLRSVGATPKQIRGMIFAEAMTVGVLASAAGCLLGTWGARQLGDVLADVGVVPPGFRAEMTTGMLIFAFCAGIVVAAAGVFAASRRASRIRPADAMRQSHTDGKVMTPGRWIVGLLALGAAVAIFIALPNIGSDGTIVFSTLLTQILVVAEVALAPLFVPLIGWLATVPLARFAPASGLLARENTRSSLRRTASTAAPVLITVAVAASVLGIVGSSNATTAADNRAHFAAGAVVMPAGGAGIPPGVAASLSGTPGVDRTISLTQTNGWLIGRTGTVPASIGGTDVQSLPQAFHLTVLEGALESVSGTNVVITNDMSNQTGWFLGQTVTVHLGDGTPVQLTVAAIVLTTGNLPGVIVSRDVLNGHLHDGMVSSVFASLTPGTGQAAAVTALAGRAGVAARVLPADTWLSEQASAAQQEGWMAVFVLLGLALLYTGIAIANTLLMTSGERVEDIRLLRRIGATGAQTIRMLVLETATVVVVGVVLGLLTAAISLAGVYTALRDASPYAELAIPWQPIGAVVLVCLVIAILATVLPGWRALHKAGRGADGRA